MKAASLIGIIIACVGMAVGATMEGSQITAVLNPSAMLIVLGGTAGATLASVGFKHGRWLDSVLMQRPLGRGDAIEVSA